MSGSLAEAVRKLVDVRCVSGVCCLNSRTLGTFAGVRGRREIAKMSEKYEE